MSAVEEINVNTDHFHRKGVAVYDLCEHVFAPEEAKRIINTTEAAKGYNFRSPGLYGNGQVNRLGAAMRAGAWMWSDANPIRLSTDWSLCSDGLHRLSACVQTGIPLRSLVLVGDRWRAGVGTDKGRTRTLAQFFASENIKHSAVKAAIVRQHVSRSVAIRDDISVHHAANVAVNDSEMIGFVDVHDERLNWVCSRTPPAASRGFNGTGYGVFLLEASFIDEDMASEFHEALVGEPDGEDDPLFRLRTFALSRFNKTGKRMASRPTTDAFVKCWDIRLVGDRLKMWKQPTWDSVRFPAGFHPDVVPSGFIRPHGV